MLFGLSQYSPFSGWTRISATSGSSLPFGNQVFRLSDHYASMIDWSRTISAFPATET